jgi:creatinine amidohydrolase/Fe(II)-dependent formamide hydrolase-like protein
VQFAIGQLEKPSSVFLEELTWTEVKEFLDNGRTTVIIPTGGTEPNGPHLVLGKHNVRVKYMAEKIAIELGNALVAPTIAHVPEGKINPAESWMKYPGTISLPEEHFIKLLEFTCRSLKQHGFIDIILIGDSGGNQNGMKVVSETLNVEWKSLKTRVHHISDFYDKPFGQMNDSLIANGFTKDIIGTHAGLLDVSYSLAIDSNLIRVEQLAQLEGHSGFNYKMAFTGDPTKASVELGEQVINLALQSSLSQIMILKIDNRK